jgi:hypothetical protein
MNTKFKKDSLSHKPGESYWESREASMDARSGGESRCDSGEYRDEDVQDFTPKCFVFHDFLDLELILVIVIQSEAKNLNAFTLCITFVYSDSSLHYVPF